MHSSKTMDGDRLYTRNPMTKTLCTLVKQPTEVFNSSTESQKKQHQNTKTPRRQNAKTTGKTPPARHWVSWTTNETNNSSPTSLATPRKVMGFGPEFLKIPFRPCRPRTPPAPCTAESKASDLVHRARPDLSCGAR